MVAAGRLRMPCRVRTQRRALSGRGRIGLLRPPGRNAYAQDPIRPRCSNDFPPAGTENAGSAGKPVGAAGLRRVIQAGNGRKPADCQVARKLKQVQAQTGHRQHPADAQEPGRVRYPEQALRRAAVEGAGPQGTGNRRANRGGRGQSTSGVHPGGRNAAATAMTSTLATNPDRRRRSSSAAPAPATAAAAAPAPAADAVASTAGRLPGHDAALLQDPQSGTEVLKEKGSRWVCRVVYFYCFSF